MSLYKKLPNSRSIRVLSLARQLAEVNEVSAEPITDPDKGWPDPRTHPVSCTMSVISVTDSEPFDALSYVWGDPSVKEGTMICDGHRIDITFNLWSALRQIWAKWPTKRVWADAICINQDDIPERNQQVTIMGTIYSTAGTVIVWLGHSTQESRRLFKILENLKNRPLLKNTSESVRASQAAPIDGLGTILTNVLSRPWFWRAWTLQEIKLARRAILCCGPEHEDFSLLTQAIDENNNSEPMAGVCGLGFIDNPIPDVGDNVTLFYLLVNTSGREASDPRDKIFSLLSLLPNDLYDFMQADYSLTEEETVIWASRIFIELDRDTACLADAGLTNRVNSTLPSWAVDWRSRDKFEHSGRSEIPRHLKSDAKWLRSRFDFGRKLDPKSRMLKTRGWGFGRLRINKKGPSAFLTVFPDCALQAVGASSETPLACHLLSAEELLRFCKKIKQHDDEKCRCMDGSRRVVYPVRNLPGKTEDGDWLWRDACDTKKMNDCLDLILRPVDALSEANSEANFQLVGKAWGEGIRGLTPATRFSLSLVHPDTVIVASVFVLV
ncbi:heterokaryon incompatibility protein-domain-containing protein [Xylariaceae sp. FL1651]|nr:heterokaryon incompatibility protein-domain-containing protein [Xylariaceae sp. FL1651]